MLLSIVIPTLNEQDSLPVLLADLKSLAVAHEVIVADGGSTDATADLAERMGARVVQARRGRGAQLAAGARMATAPVLCFLHADVRVHEPARREIETLASSWRAGAHAFRFCIDAPGWRYRFIELGTRLRVLLFRMPYGDQGLIVSRSDHDAAGGYRDLPLMEDVAMVDALSAVTVIRPLRSELPVSPRRWEQDGPLTRMMRNWRLMLAYRLGASPQSLAAQYRPRGDTPLGDAQSVRSAGRG